MPLFNKAATQTCGIDKRMKNDANLRSLAAVSELTSGNSARVLGPLQSAFSADRDSLDLLIFCCKVPMSDGKVKRGDEERIVNKKVFGSNLNATRSYLSDLGCESIADQLPQEDVTRCHWALQVTGMNSSFSTVAWGLAGFPYLNTDDVHKVQKAIGKRAQLLENEDSVTDDEEAKDDVSLGEPSSSRSEASEARRHSKRRGRSRERRSDKHREVKRDKRDDKHCSDSEKTRKKRSHERSAERSVRQDKDDEQRDVPEAASDDAEPPPAKKHKKGRGVEARKKPKDEKTDEPTKVKTGDRPKKHEKKRESVVRIMLPKGPESKRRDAGDDERERKRTKSEKKEEGDGLAQAESSSGLLRFASRTIGRLVGGAKSDPKETRGSPSEQVARVAAEKGAAVTKEEQYAKKGSTRQVTIRDEGSVATAPLPTDIKSAALKSINLIEQAPLSLAGYMSTNIARVGLDASGSLMTRKVAVQTGGSLERAGVPTAVRICSLITEGISTGNMVELENLTKMIEEMEKKAGMDSKEIGRFLPEFQGVRAGRTPCPAR